MPLEGYEFVTGRTPTGQIISVGLLELPGGDDVYRVAEVTMLSLDQAAAAGKAIGGRDLMTTPDELRKAMAEQDFTKGEVITGQRPVSVVFSFRAPAEWSEEILAEMQRRGLDNPSQLMKALLREGLDRAAGGNARVVTVRVDDLHRAIDSIVTSTAA